MHGFVPPPPPPELFITYTPESRPPFKHDLLRPTRQPQLGQPFTSCRVMGGQSLPRSYTGTLLWSRVYIPEFTFRWPWPMHAIFISKYMKQYSMNYPYKRTGCFIYFPCMKLNSVTFTSTPSMFMWVWLDPCSCGCDSIHVHVGVTPSMFMWVWLHPCSCGCDSIHVHVGVTPSMFMWVWLHPCSCGCDSIHVRVGVTRGCDPGVWHVQASTKPRIFTEHIL